MMLIWTTNIIILAASITLRCVHWLTPASKIKNYTNFYLKSYYDVSVKSNGHRKKIDNKNFFIKSMYSLLRLKSKNKCLVIILSCSWSV